MTVGLRATVNLMGRPRRLALFAALALLLAAADAGVVYSLYLFGVTLTAGGVALPGPAFASRLVASVAAAWHVDPLLPIALAVVGSTLLRSALGVLQERLIFREMVRAVGRLLDDLFDGYFGLRYEVFLSRNSIDRVNSMAVEAERAGQALASLLRMQAAGTNLAILCVLLVSIDARAFALGAVVGGLLVLAVRPLLRRTSRLGEQRGPAARELWRSLSEPLRAYRAVVAFDATGRFREEMAERYRRFSRVLDQANLARSLLPAILEVGVALVVGASVAGAVLLLASPRAAFPVLLLLMATTYRLVPGLSGFYAAASAYRTGLPGLQRIETERSENKAFHHPPDGRHAVLDARGLVARLQGVEFSYGGPAVLQGIDLDVAAGERIGIVGPSGSGKSTIVDVVLGLLRPTAGEVALGRRPDGSPARLSYVPQQSILLDATVLENLDPSQPAARIDRAAAQRALDRVGLGAGSPHPVELDRPLAEGGARLSGGQRQRIGVARALLREPDILLLDEPTAALDDATERRLVEELDALPMAMLVVTHREAPLELCDRVYRLEHGRLVPVPAP